MAKAKDLAGLAALGALGYMLSKDKPEQENKGRQSDDAGYKSTETREEPRRKIEGYQKKAPLDDTDKYPSGVMGGARSSSGTRGSSAKSETATASKSTPATAESPAAPSIPGGSKKRAEGNEPMPSLKAVESRAASNKTDAMKSASRAQQAGINRQKAMRANPESQAAEAVYPEQYITPGGGFKTAANMAKNLANRGGKQIAEYSTPRLAAPTKQLTGPSKADLVARDRAARAAGRQEEMLKENAANYGLNPNAPGYEATAGALRKNLGGDDFTIMKKGGKVKKMASGGMTASRRADGIATRGKTKCKMY